MTKEGQEEKDEGRMEGARELGCLLREIVDWGAPCHSEIAR